MMPERDAPAAGVAITDDVPCPFCGILCDDLSVRRTQLGLEVAKHGCEKARAGFERVLPATRPRIRGAEVSHLEAIREAARIIGSAKLPLYGGLGTDVDGVRAVLALADKTKGAVDHALSDALFRNYRVLQTSGWITTTLTEARNRADMFVIIASDIAKSQPRFFERVVTPAATMFAHPAPKRDVVFIGSGLAATEATGPRIGTVDTLTCPNDQTGEVISALRALLHGAPVTAHAIAGVPIETLRVLADRLRAASYPVFVWAPAAFEFANADLLVHAICELVKDLNQTGRAAGLSLGGSEGSASAASVCAWQTGYPLRVRYGNDGPQHDASRFALTRMIADGEGDCLVWLSSFNTGLKPPDVAIPLVLLATPGTEGETRADVFIPIGTPGLDHAGRLIRCDSVVSLALKNLGRSDLPRAADVLAAIEAAL
jgi:formylmethanofuran dehydrogenase subunit B